MKPCQVCEGFAGEYLRFPNACLRILYFLSWALPLYLLAAKKLRLLNGKKKLRLAMAILLLYGEKSEASAAIFLNPVLRQESMSFAMTPRISIGWVVLVRMIHH